MLDIINDTPFSAFAMPVVCHQDNNHVVIIIKGTFELNQSKSVVTLADEQAEIFLEDEHWGEPEKSSMKFESDLVHTRTTTNVSMVGHAWAINGPAAALDVGVKIGLMSKVVKVFGDRYWDKLGKGWQISSPEAFEKVPLNYENAYGGLDELHTDPKIPGFEQRNPVGKGFVLSGGDRIQDFPLPNIEYSSTLISNWRDKPAPAGFGTVGRNWLPRKQFAGTYDENWLKTRNPLLPKDFNTRYYDNAAGDLKTPTFLQGGEILQVVNASENGPVDCILPTIRFSVEANVDNQSQYHTVQLDTVVIDPDENRVMLCWRGSFPCHWNLAKVLWIKLGLEQCDVAI